MTYITGAGGGGGKSGGGGGGGTPTEVADNLDSKQYAKLIDLISEGEIEGVKGGMQGIYINNTPLQNPNGTYNFTNVEVTFCNGTQAQAALPGNTAIEDEKPVGVTVAYPTPVVRTVSDPEVDAVRVTISIPQLQEIEDDGDIKGQSTRVLIAVQYDGGGYTTVVDNTISGRTSDQYQRDYLINLSGAFPVDIKVSRGIPDSTSAKVANAFSWSSYTELIYAKLRYPNSALVGIRVDAEQFNSIPSRAYLVRGIKVRVPNNATVDSATGRLIYSGIWGGTFGAAQWCSDPAWILWDLLTSTRYGFGDHVDATQLDKWAFYSASQYCNELVPTGFGGFEPRFSCNVNIQTSEEAYKLINDMCSVFRAMPYWSSGALTISQDKPADTSYLFTLANVSEEGFTYSGSSRKTRPTVAVVSYLDLDQRDIAYEEVEDIDGIRKYGVVKAEISAFACTSRGQAARIGEWLLYAERYENEVVSFTASIDAGVVVRPGQIIEISDPVRAGARRGGRIMASTTTTVTVDDATGLPASGGTVSVILPTGVVESRSMSTRSGAVLTVTSAFSVAPNVNSVWIYQSSGLQTSTWRVLSVQEQDGAQYAVTALAYNSSKYAYIERDRPLQFRDVTDLNQIPVAPTNLRGAELLYAADGKVFSKLIISWKPVVGVNQYRYRWRRVNGNWQGETQQRVDFEILNTTPGLYEIEVYSLNAAQKPSTNPAKLTYNALGKSAAPADITNAYGNALTPESLELAWDLHPDLDVQIGGKILIRHTPSTTGALWANATTAVPAAAGNQTRKVVPLMAGTYLLRAQDDTGNLSVNAVAVVVEEALEPQPVFVVRIASSPVSNPNITFAEDLTTPPFQGNLTNMYYDADLDGLIISYGQLIDSMANDAEPGGPLLDETGLPILSEAGDEILSQGEVGSWDDLDTIDGYGGPQPTGEYEFGSTMDLNAIYEVRLRARMKTRAFNPANLWDSYVDIDSLTIIDDVSGKPDAQLLYRASQNGTTYGAWTPFQANLVRGRSFQFKAVATSGDSEENIVIEELGATALLPQVMQSDGPLTSGATTYTATFAKPFYGTPRVLVTGVDTTTGDYATLANVTRTGFQVTFRNSGGTAVSRQFYYQATGYGREI